jgi:hypothetical protein
MRFSLKLIESDSQFRKLALEQLAKEVKKDFANNEFQPYLSPYMTRTKNYFYAIELKNKE